jgi:hypothetical protein
MCLNLPTKRVCRVAKSKPITYTYPLVVIGLDPGVTSGVSVFRFTVEDCEFIEHMQWGSPDTVWEELQALADHYNETDGNVVLVIESFDKRPGIVSPDYTPKYINRDIKNHLTGYPIIWQIPAAAKTLVPPARKGGTDALKRFGFYRVSNRHANDATRHVIVFAVDKLMHYPTILKGWPQQ